MKPLLSDDLKKISDAIADVEQNTAGEIMPVIVKQSDVYPAAHFRCALLVTLITTLALSFEPWFPIRAVWILFAQIPAFVFGFALAYIPFVKYLFLSKQERAEETHQRALELFLENNLHMTRDHTGVMLFVSLLERRAEIVADVGITQKVDQKKWDVIMHDLLQGIGQGIFVDSLCKAIVDCGIVLAQNFPARFDDTNEIKNTVLVV